MTHDAMVDWEIRDRSCAQEMAWGWVASPFGRALVLVSARGLAGLGFEDTRGQQACEADLMGCWPEVVFRKDQALAQSWGRRVFASPHADLPLHLRGSRFQLAVWEALLQIPPGQCVTYSALAMRLNKDSRSARALGSAVGRNPVSWLVPCHRVVRKDGGLGGYRWGLALKSVLLSADAQGHRSAA